MIRVALQGLTSGWVRSFWKGASGKRKIYRDVFPSKSAWKKRNDLNKATKKYGDYFCKVQKKIAMKYFIIVFLATFLGGVKAQDAIIVGDSPCSKKIYIKSHLYKKYPFDSYFDFLQKYVRDQYPESINCISINSNNLQAIPVNICSGGKVVIEKNDLYDDTFKINISTEDLELKFDMEFINSNPYTILQFEIEKRLGYNYFGYVKENGGNVKIRQINKIIYKTPSDTICLKETLFQDLLNPNLGLSCSSTQPIRAFFDSSKKLIYLYIDGALPGKESDIVDDSFVAKIIINLTTKKVSRIVVPGSYLSTYGWTYCPKFWVM